MTSPDDEIDTPRRPGDRRHMSVSDVATLIGLMISVATIVWGASAIKSSVDSLREAMVLMTAQVKETQTVVNRLSVDVGILQDRVYKK